MTRSQHLALLGIVLAHARMPDQPQIFVDGATGARTSTGELLVELTAEIAARKDVQDEQGKSQRHSERSGVDRQYGAQRETLHKLQDTDEGAYR